MPRITVVDEKAYTENYKAYVKDPGAYRGPYDFCRNCWRHLSAVQLSEVASISEDWAREHLKGGLMDIKEGLYEDCHPNYAGIDYECALCGASLDALDD